MNNKEIMIKVGANVDQFKAAMATMETHIKNMAASAGAHIKKMAASSEAFDAMRKDVGAATQSIESFVKKGAVLGTNALGIVEFGMNARAQLETAEMGFKTLLGSTEAARKAIDMIKKDAKATKFDIAGLASANQLLTAVNGDAERSERVLLNVGKALRYMGRGTQELDGVARSLQSMAQAGEVTKRGVEQLADSGIDAYGLIADSTGMTSDEVRKLYAEGKLTFDMLEKAFNDAGEGSGKFAKAFENDRETWNQTWSSFQETISDAMATIVEKSGLFEEVKKQVKSLTDWVESNKDSIANFVKGAFEWIVDHGETIKNVIIGIVAAYGALKTVEAVMSVVDGFQSALRIGLGLWRGATIAFTAVQWLLNGALTVFNLVMSANPIVLVTLLIVGLIAALIWFFTQTEVGKELLSKFFSAVEAGFKAVVDWVSSTASNIGKFFSEAWTTVTNIFTGIGSWFGDRFREAWNGLTSVFSGIGGFFQDVWNKIVNIFGKVGGAVGDAISGAVKGVVNKILDGAESIINGFINSINGAINVLNKLPGVNFGKLGHLNLPRLATGGIVEARNGGTNVTVAEGGQSEWVVPESKMASLVAQLNRRMEYGDGVSGREINQTFNVTVEVKNDGTDFTQAQAESMAKKITQALRAQGLSLLEMGALR